MPGLHCDDLGHLCFHKQETDASEFLCCLFYQLRSPPRKGGGGGGGVLSCAKFEDCRLIS